MSKYEVWLCDDGTLDTVVEYTCPDCGRTHEFRYCASDRDYRSRTTGAFTASGWQAFLRDVVIPDIDSDTCPLAD